MGEALQQQQKRIKTMGELVLNKEGTGEGDLIGGGGGSACEMALEVMQGSEEMEHNIQQILENIEVFTQQVSDMLEAWKSMLRNLSMEFEDRLISIHKEEIEKWQEEIKELQSRDASNEAARALLENAQHMLHNVHQGSRYPLFQNDTGNL